MDRFQLLLLVMGPILIFFLAPYAELLSLGLVESPKGFARILLVLNVSLTTWVCWHWRDVVQAQFELVKWLLERGQMLLELGRWHRQKPVVQRFSDPETCLKLLSGAPWHDSLTNRLSLQVSRAIPNQRLVRAFQIDNGFTTKDKDYGRDFRKEAITHIGDVTRGGWNRVGKWVQLTASATFEQYKDCKSAHLDLIIQVVTLKVVVFLFFDIEPDVFRDDQAARIARKINELWMLSKSDTRNLSSKFKPLQMELEKLLGRWHHHKRFNPLNMILPAYETLWRVVLNCLIEVAFRPSAGWLTTLAAFAADSNSKTFNHEPEYTPGYPMSSVADLVKEALRLYPPTRRIYRQVHLSSERKSRLVAADIEACHRQRDIWLGDIDSYNPGRWVALTESQRQAFMPFGGKPWICPASSGFAPMMIGLLVATFAELISAEEWELHMVSGDESRVLDDDMQLNSDRQENSVWEIVKRNPWGMGTS